jgi:hypothetical protein
LFPSMFIYFNKNPIFFGFVPRLRFESWGFYCLRVLAFDLVPAPVHILQSIWYFGVTFDASITTLGWGEVGHPEYHCRQGLSSSRPHEPRLWGPPSLLFIGLQGIFPCDEFAGAWSRPLTSGAEVNNVWQYTSILTNV